MKAEAPEKIYISHHTVTDSMGEPVEEFGEEWSEEKEVDNDIEYIRKDAFIENAVEWLMEHKEVVETEDNGIMGWIPDYFIEDFKKYMKGE